MPDPQYSTFWPRFFASFLDALIVAPLFFAANRLPFAGYVAVQALGNIAYYALVIYCHARFGKTPGKWLLGLRVVRNTGHSPISFPQSFLRSAVDVALGIAQLAANLQAVSAIQGWETLGSAERLNELVRFHPAWAVWLNYCWNTWLLLEILLTLSNKKRRSPSDYIAGTVVLVEPKAT